jgi:PAS domain S-box-containing protein
MRSFLTSIVESSDDSIIGTDLEGTILSWNGGAERLWGYSAAEAIGRHITILFLPDRRPDYLNSLGKVQRQERVERLESVRIRKDGTPIEVSVILSPIKDDHGQLQSRCRAERIEYPEPARG